MIKKPKTTKSNGTKDAVSRYSTMKAKFDNDVSNTNWQEVNTKKINTGKAQINYIDLFAGAGGLSQGFKQAGFNKIMSVEIDNDASNTIRRNFPESHHFEGSIEDLQKKKNRSLVSENT